MLPHLQTLLAISTWVRLRRLGGWGLVLLGIADNSVVPLTGSMDVLTIWLAARHREPWPYYALMATVGAVLGGYITYSLARKGGKQAMERRLSKRKAAKVYQRFERWGFGAIAIPAVLPPPFPFFPFLLAAGAMQYSRQKFLWRTGARPRNSLFDRCLPRNAIWEPHPAFFFSIPQRSAGHTDRPCSRGWNSYTDPISSVQVRTQLMSLEVCSECFLCVPSCPLWLRHLKASTTKGTKVHEGRRLEQRLRLRYNYRCVLDRP